MSSQLLVRAIPPYDEVLSRATEWERAEAEVRFSTESRRAEWLTWRSVVRELVGEQAGKPMGESMGEQIGEPRGEQLQIGYNSLGAPECTLDNHIIYIGVSHCRGRVAVAVSEHPCGVDIEWSSRNFERASAKYLSAEERATERVHPDRMCGAVWCAKEAVYKFFSAKGHKYPDFLNDIRVTQSNLADGRMTLAVGEEPITVEVRIEWREDGLIVASVGV